MPEPVRGSHQVASAGPPGWGSHRSRLGPRRERQRYISRVCQQKSPRRLGRLDRPNRGKVGEY